MILVYSYELIVHHFCVVSSDIFFFSPTVPKYCLCYAVSGLYHFFSWIDCILET